ncbi:hypothetical protein C1752_05062 [Acaryochloris thomasi RCC1774]|uniref:DUF3007 family protein n=1 Tax=Acaryochloris thomasi RCC1774 TaxID=1764569 RepID=A0A2W1JRF6_9CYAN|nr:DUF3007 family protein [Acaryochloris thomasi]PZD71701.1 hypothetical protein C1752_05062 [Acaryochloris thomasi RCC1774]
MRRIDALAIGFGVFIAGGLIYAVFRLAGIEGQNAGIWSQVILVAGLIGWVASYLLRVVTQKMTYNQQLEEYEDAVLQKRLDEMTPEELEQLQAEIDAESNES